MQFVESIAPPKRFTIPRPRESRVIPIYSRCLALCQRNSCCKLPARNAALNAVPALVKPLSPIKWLAARHAIENITCAIHPVELRHRNVSVQKDDLFILLLRYSLLQNIEKIFLVKQNRLRLDDMRLAKVFRRSRHCLHSRLSKLDAERRNARIN